MQVFSFRSSAASRPRVHCRRLLALAALFMDTGKSGYENAPSRIWHLIPQLTKENLIQTAIRAV